LRNKNLRNIKIKVNKRHLFI